MGASNEGSIVVTSTRFPLLLVEFIGKASDEQFQSYLSALDEHLQRCLATQKRSIVIVDTLAATSPVSAAQRKMQAEWMARSHLRSKNTMAGMAFVINNVVVRGVLTAILWLQTMPCEYTVCATRAEAEDWAARRLGSPSLAPRRDAVS